MNMNTKTQNCVVFRTVACVNFSVAVPYHAHARNTERARERERERGRERERERVRQTRKRERTRDSEREKERENGTEKETCACVFKCGCMRVWAGVCTNIYTILQIEGPCIHFLMKRLKRLLCSSQNEP